ISIRENDALIDAELTDGSQEIMLATQNGKAIRFSETEVREMGRTAAGVRGIRVSNNDAAIGMVVLKREGSILVVTEKGYGKRTVVDDYSLQHRGGSGVITIKTNEKTGKLMAIKEVVDEDDFMIITQKGIIIRQNVASISIIGRNTQGVRLIRLDDGDTIADVTRVFAADGNGENGEISTNGVQGEQ
ncbi:MAG: DNA gyrase C-terminal beta-propeller domain-containing protein, partial [bacterium]